LAVHVEAVCCTVKGAGEVGPRVEGKVNAGSDIVAGREPSEYEAFAAVSVQGELVVAGRGISFA